MLVAQTAALMPILHSCKGGIVGSDIDEKREVVVFARDRATEGVARDQRDPKVPISLSEGHLLDDDRAPSFR